jgi:BioD-like phosphotransacetylase family protein
MARKIFIAATGQDCGKTTTSLSLLHLARQKYQRVGFIKPFGPKPVQFAGRWMDKDAATVAMVYGLEDDLDWMSPVVLQPGDTREVLDGKIPVEQFEQQIVAACRELEQRCDFLIIEGAGHSGVGSVLGLSNARIARLLEAPVVLVAGGGIGQVVDDISMNLALYRQEGAEVKMVIPNKLIASKRERTLHYLELAFRNEPFMVYGGYNYSPILAGPTLQHVAQLLNWPLRATPEQAMGIIHHIHLGAASVERVINLLEPATLVVVTSSRDEMLVLLASIYDIPEYREKLAGVVIAGMTPVSKVSQQILNDSELPYVRAQQITAEVFLAITEDVAKISGEDQEKISLIQSLAEQQLDFDVIDAQLV